jgi:hypothetical protein
MDLIALSNRLADEFGVPREVMLGCAVAESNLNPDARRPKSPADDPAFWPDVSFGLWQQTVRWSREYADWCQANGHLPGAFPGHDVIARIGAFYTDPEYAGRKAAPQLATYWRQERDPLNCLCRYNKPNLDPFLNPNRANYQRGLNEARRLLTVPEDGMLSEAALSDLWKAVRGAKAPPMNTGVAIVKKWMSDPYRYGSPLGPERPQPDGSAVQMFTIRGLRWVGGDTVEEIG